MALKDMYKTQMKLVTRLVDLDTRLTQLLD